MLRSNRSLLWVLVSRLVSEMVWMRSIHLFVMLSLDGYFEGPNHEGEKIAKRASSSLESHHVNVIAVNPGGPTTYVWRILGYSGSARLDLFL